MSFFMICWMVAGWFIGNIVSQLLFGLVKMKTSDDVKFSMGFVGVLVVYTILR